MSLCFAVMRLTKPTLFTNLPVTCEDRDLPGKRGAEWNLSLTVFNQRSYRCGSIDFSTCYFSISPLSCGQQSVLILSENQIKSIILPQADQIQTSKDQTALQYVQSSNSWRKVILRFIIRPARLGTVTRNWSTCWKPKKTRGEHANPAGSGSNPESLWATTTKPLWIQSTIVIEKPTVGLLQNTDCNSVHEFLRSLHRRFIITSATKSNVSLPLLASLLLLFFSPFCEVTSGFNKRPARDSTYSIFLFKYLFEGIITKISKCHEPQPPQRGRRRTQEINQKNAFSLRLR